MNQLEFTFDLDAATDYMRTMFHLEAQRDELNTAINEARASARDDGVPTKAVEAAIRAAKGRDKSALSPAEFAKLMDLADDMLAGRPSKTVELFAGSVTWQEAEEVVGRLRKAYESQKDSAHVAAPKPIQSNP